MKRFLFGAVLMGCGLLLSSPALAIKQLNDKFKEQYAGDDANADFKKLVTDAKCNVCHIERQNKKNVRNPYGTALHDALEKDEFPIKEFKKTPDKYAERLNKIFKEIEKGESGDAQHKTFADRMKANLLPGGTIAGKPE